MVRRRTTRPVRRTLRTQKKTWWLAMPWLVRAHIWVGALVGLTAMFFMCGGLGLLGLVGAGGAAVVHDYETDPARQAERIQRRMDAVREYEQEEAEKRAHWAEKAARGAHLRRHIDGECACDEIIDDPTYGPYYPKKKR